MPAFDMLEGRYPYLNGLSLQVIAGDHDGLHSFGFGFGFDLLLEGVERLRLSS